MKKLLVHSARRYIDSKKSDTLDLVEASNSKIGKLVKELRGKGFKVTPWWEPGVFSDAKSFIETIAVKASAFDGIVILIGDADVVEALASKENNRILLVELGAFIGVKGLQNVFIVDDTVEGNQYAVVHNHPSSQRWKFDDAASDKIFEFFSARNEGPYVEFTFYYNREHIQAIIDKKYQNWSTKALYVGSESARRWKEIEKGTDYLQNSFSLTDFMEHIKGENPPIIDFRQIDNIISLGPGCGKFDDFIVSKIYDQQQGFSYIPVDINPHLAFEAGQYLKNYYPAMLIPFAIIDDFENNFKYVGDIIRRKVNSHKQVNLFMMLGGTFSNLEGTEHILVHKLSSWMDHNDYFILDAFIKTDAYVFSEDRKRHVEGEMPISYKRLLTNASIKRYLSYKSELLDDEDRNFLANIQNDLSKYMHQIEEHNIANVYTEVKKTSVARYLLKLGLKSTDKEIEMLVAKRYDFQELENFLQNSFDVLYSYAALSQTATTGRGLFLLKKKAQFDLANHQNLTI